MFQWSSGNGLTDKSVVFKLVQMPVEQGVTGDQGKEAGQQVTVTVIDVAKTQRKQREKNIRGQENRDHGDQLRLDVEIEHEDHDGQQHHLQEYSDKRFFQNQRAHGRELEERGNIRGEKQTKHRDRPLQFDETAEALSHRPCDTVLICDDALQRSFTEDGAEEITKLAIEIRFNFDQKVSVRGDHGYECDESCSVIIGESVEKGMDLLSPGAEPEDDLVDPDADVVEKANHYQQRHFPEEVQNIEIRFFVASEFDKNSRQQDEKQNHLPDCVAVQESGDAIVIAQKCGENKAGRKADGKGIKNHFVVFHCTQKNHELPDAPDCDEENQSRHFVQEVDLPE